MFFYIITPSIQGAYDMCDIKKYQEIYQELIKLQPEDTLQLVLESESEDQKDFYEMLGDYLLQKKQREIIKKDLF